VYLLEAGGAGIGGLAYTFFAIPYLNSFQTASLLGAANLISGILLVFRSGRRPERTWTFLALWGIALSASLLLFLPQVSRMVEKKSLAGLWPGFEILESRWSPYGNAAVARREGQLTFFSNGVPVGNVPIPDVALMEERAHYPLLLSPSPRNILVVGGGFGGLIREILKHPVERVHYAEIDPLVIEFIGRYATPLTREEMEDPRVRVHRLDGRLFIKTTTEKFDLVLLNLPAPTTLELNRFYTVEFFREVFRLLAGGGLLALSLPGSETYLGPEARDLNLSVLRSLEETFSSAAVIPGDPNVIVASPVKNWDGLEAGKFIQGLRERKIRTQFLTEAHIRRKVEKQRLEWWEESLRQGGAVRLNRDGNPSGVYYGIAYWNAQFHPSVQAFWGTIGGFRLSHFGLALLALVGLLSVYRTSGWGRKGEGGAKAALLWVVTTTGSFGTAMSVLLILSFQTLYGYAYQWIGLLVAAFMAGLALGAWVMNRELEKIRNRALTLFGLEGFIALFCLLLIFILDFLYSREGEFPGLWPVQAAFLLMSLASGFWAGQEFPLSGRIFAGREEGVGRTAGILYAADLFGAWAGALFVGVIFIPVLGILMTCGAMVLLKLASLALLSLTDLGRRLNP
jgi:spermidine synthase